MTRRIFAAGQGLNRTLIRYFGELTGKSKPKICLVPTATGDHPRWIAAFHDIAGHYGFESHVLPLFISSFDCKTPYEEVLLEMDAIYVGGGNTLNMLAVWDVQGVVPILREAYEQGILLGGGSAGGICWFENGLTDSRPVELTAMDAMGWLKGSFAPHYLSEPGRRQYYHKYITEGSLSDGYGVDEPVALLFENEELSAALGAKPGARAFKVELVDGRIEEQELPIQYVG